MTDLADDMDAIFNYIMAMKRNSLAKLERGEEPEVIMVYADDCSHCHAEFRLFMRPNKGSSHGLDVPVEIVELTRSECELMYKKGKITKACLDNKLEVIDRIIPVNKTSVLGVQLKAESKEWAKKTGNPDAILDMTPMWVHFRTHEVIGVGHRAGKNLKTLTSVKKNVSRQNRFEKIYTTVIGKTCTTVSCDPKTLVKVNGKTYKKMG